MVGDSSVLDNTLVDDRPMGKRSFVWAGSDVFDPPLTAHEPFYDWRIMWLPTIGRWALQVLINAFGERIWVNTSPEDLVI